MTLARTRRKCGEVLKMAIGVRWYNFISSLQSVLNIALHDSRYMSTTRTGAIWNALIRTHHITSRKKVAKLKQAAATHNVFALLRSGGCPGIMYVQGSQSGVEDWVAVVQVGDGFAV